MRRKLLPALYHLSRANRLSKPFVILGVARNRDHTDDSYRKLARKALRDSGTKRDELEGWCDHCLHYQSIYGGTAEDFERLEARIRQIESDHGLPGNRVFYLALSPASFVPTIEGLGHARLNKAPGWSRLVVEKPFGRDLETARALNRVVHTHFDESQVYRIDHYLGKETVQNLLVFRFANPMFESVWNRDRVRSVEISVAEDLGVGSRAGYYDKAGAVRDMVQNHLTQLLTLTAMEAPSAFDADAIRDEKVKVLRALKPLEIANVVRGQYTDGSEYGERIPGYLDEEGVDPKSMTETYAAFRLEISNWRWQGVPFYLRTGKRLGRRLTQVAVRFRVPPVSLFRPYPHCRLHSNQLVLTLQPNEGFALGFDVKTPGQQMQLETQHLSFEYESVYGPLPDGYETLLYDIVTEDQTLFVRADEVEKSWAFYASVLDNTALPVETYHAGSDGPDAAIRLIAETGDRWQPIG